MHTPLSKKEIATSLIGVVKLHAAVGGHSIAPSCLIDLEKVAKSVAAQLDASDAGDLLAAEDGAKALVHRMIAAARVKGYDGVLHEDTLAEAKKVCGIIFWCGLWKRLRRR